MTTDPAGTSGQATIVTPQALATTAAPSAPADKLSAQEQKEKALQERLDKRGTIIANSMRKFLAGYMAGRQKMLDEARAAELAKKLRAGKKGKRGKKAAPEAKGKDKGKAGDKKKVVKTPVQEAWTAFLADLDERINKQKRCTLEDMYRGVDKLSPEERRALACIVVASNNKKVLPTEGQNINSLNIRAAVFAAAAAFDVPVDKATLSASSGLATVSQRAASEQQLLQFGFKPADLLRVGCSRPDVIALSLPGHLDQLHSAGIQPSELLNPDACGGLAAAPWQPEQQLGSHSGAAALRAAGYGAAEVLEAGVHSAWDLRRGGYSQAELQEAGVSPTTLREAGFGDPVDQPMGFMASSLRPLCHYRPKAFPPDTTGTTDPMWDDLLRSKAPATPALSTGGRGGGMMSFAVSAAAAVGAHPQSHGSGKSPAT